jgi:glycosyltransferase involved in cell wall biosynthesis
VRIALVHYTYLPVIAGVELVMAEHARLFRVAGHDVEVIADFEARGDRLVEDLRPVFAEQDVVILHNVATMHFHPQLTAAVWKLADELTAVRFICWVHDLAAVNPDYAPLPLDREPWALLARAHPRFTYVAVSELRRRQFIELTAQPASRCRTIPNGVDPTHLFDLPPRIAGLVERHALLERDFVLLHPTRLLRRKNVALTLQVAAALNAAGRSCAALITAPPEVHYSALAGYESGLRELRERLGLWNDALFLHDDGPLLDHELHALFRVADALFFPSRQEGFGIPLLEAALHRMPVFCSDIEPLNTLLGAGVTTFPLDAEPEEIAARIVATLAADRAFAARKETLRTYSWSAIYRNFLSPLLAETETATPP